MAKEDYLHVPYGKTVHGQEEIDAVVTVLQTSTQMGNNVRELEDKISTLYAKKHGIMVNSGSSALYLAVELMDLEYGDEVITPALTFATTVAPIVRAGLVPAFVDVEEGTYNLDANNITLLGFSQGCILSLATAISYPNLAKNVIGLSGYIDPEMLMPGYENGDFTNLNIFISHGSVDQVIPLEWAQKTPAFLEKIGIESKLHEYPVGHGVAPQNFYDLKEWEALDDDLKMIVKQAAANTNLMVLSRFQAANNTALQTLINEHDVNLAPYSDELIKAIGERATTVIPELAQKSADATELYNNLVTFRKTMVQWSGYSEGNFMNKRIAASFQTI